MRSLALIAIFCACGDNGTARPHDARPGDAPPGDAELATCKPASGTQIRWRFVAATHGPAVIVVSPPADPRLFVVEQQGTIRIVGDHQPSEPFLDLSAMIACCGEQGLLGLAFDPQYAVNGTFYVFYTTADANVLARYQVSATDPNRADPASGVVLLSIPDFASNHNAGMLEFGPDGYLYVTTGDGGGAGDPQLNGQNPHALLAKLLRIDPAHEAAPLHYSIPAGNPFADGVAGAPEVYDYGFRNPWRWAFDTANGDLWIGDVGQGDYEELDLIPAGAPAGQNFGWSLYEGPGCYNNGNGNGTCSPAGITMPQFSIVHDAGWCAIIGGDVYRGTCAPDLAGAYLFTDYCKGVLEVATKTGAATFDVTAPSDVTTVDGDSSTPGSPATPSSLHKAAGGELYLTTTTCCGSSLSGAIYRLEVGS